ncbi:MAG: hypothetical protein H2172_14045 [Opitutus sp.]|nr:hypothetical protein [Opitutus sp.]MCS6248463.1 hypothetical protein [Opitutus sp.]MCS6274445.1 hypothetical protein [Opitutus sp.]MCS6277599.1 hypothetical protein [Opitutus sp.]MCS6300717.1 hypothetical protein [Opitutus sp.]
MKTTVLTAALAPLFTVSLLTTSRAADAQPDPFKLNLPGFSARAGATTTGKSDLKAGGSVSSTAYDLGVSQTIPFGEKVSFDVGLSYGEISLDQSTPNARTPLPKELRSVSLDLGYSQEINDTWSLAAGISPGVHSAGSGFSSKGFGVNGYALATYNYSPHLSFSGGLSVNSLGKDLIGPAFGVTWTINDQWSASVGYPTTAITYTLSKTWQFSMLADGTGGSYYVERDPLPGAAGRPSLKGSTLDYSEFRLGLSVNYQVSTSVGVTLASGVVVDQQFEYHDPHYKVKSDAGAGYASIAVNVAF